MSEVAARVESRGRPCVSPPVEGTTCAAALMVTPAARPNIRAVLIQLQALAQEQAKEGQQTREVQIDRSKEEMQAAAAKMLEAFKRAEEEKDGGFWGDVAEIAGDVATVAAVVGAIALTVATAGAGAPFVLAVVGAVLAAGAAAESKFQVLEKLGVDPEVAKWIAIGMSVGSALCGAGAGFLAAGGAAATGVQAAAKVVGTCGSFAGAAAGIAGGASGMVLASRDAASKRAEADGTEAQNAQQRLQDLVRRLIDAIEEAMQNGRAVTSALVTATQRDHEARLRVAGMRA